jgi:hypothetical protein
LRWITHSSPIQRIQPLSIFDSKYWTQYSDKLLTKKFPLQEQRNSPAQPENYLPESEIDHISLPIPKFLLKFVIDAG